MPLQQDTQQKLVLNIAPITVPDNKVPVGRQAYESAEQLQSLWQTYRGTHILKRRGDSIIDVPVAAGAKPVGKAEDMLLKSDLGICASLIREAFLCYLAKLVRAILRHSPVDFLADENLLRRCLPQNVTCPQWLGVVPRYQFDARVHYSEERKPILVLAVAVRTARIISAPCSDLISAGVDVCGRYVQETLSPIDPRLQPGRSLVGRVVATEGDCLALCDAREGRDSIVAAQAYLEPRHENLRLCVSAVFRDKAELILRNLDAATAQAMGGPGRLKRIREAVAHLAKQHLEIVPGISFRVGSLLSQDQHAEGFPALQREIAPVYVFDAGAHTAQWHDKGLDDFGPYDQRTFTPSRPEIAVICQSRHRGQTEQFLKKLLDGVHSVTNKSGREPFGKGLQRKYCIEKCQLEFFEAIDDSPAAYKKAVGQAIDAATDRNSKWNLAIVQIEDRFHALSGDANPYLVSKGAFLSQGITSQEVELETMQLPDQQLVYVLNNIALACYAKLGGTPWLLQANRAIAHELVFGLGSAYVGEGRLGERERVVGITTVFSGDGNYLLENRSRAVSWDEYPQVLLESLKATVAQVRQTLNWQPRDAVRLVFHAFKPFQREHVAAVKEVVAGLDDYEVKFAFVHVVEDHPYLLFDEAQTEGVWDRQSRTKKGLYAPSRGQWLKLGDYEGLLVLTGAKEVKRPGDGLPRPVLLRVDKESTFKDLRYLTRQVYQFSCHSWRSFFPAPKPITILYSGLIASLLGSLSRLSKWDPQALHGPIGRSRWFL